MRDLLVVGIVLAGSLYALRYPWFGVMLWTWVSLMNPHAMGYGFVRGFPVAAIIAIATLVGLVVTKDRQNPFSDSPPIWLLLFMIWICCTYPFSYNVDGSTEMFTKVLKVDLMILVALMLLKTRRHIEILVWVVVGSLGFYGVKGGLFTIMTGGNYRVWGPGGFIGGNNEVALALIVVIPLMRYLQLQAKNRWVRHGFTASMLLSAAAALGSHSRGALLAIAAMALFLWLKSPKKIGFGVFLSLAGVLLVIFMPDNWSDRMHSIGTYEQDASAMGRINAWWTAVNVARAHVTGAGFYMYSAEIFSRFAPDPRDIHAAHSIYFQVLGEHGFIGLFLFLAIWWSVWRMARSITNYKSMDLSLLWAKQLAAMCQVSLVGYFVGGAFLSLAYFDLPYNLLVMTVLTKRWLIQKQAEPARDRKAIDQKASVAKEPAA